MKQDLFLKKYELTKEVLGCGEFGKVFKARRRFAGANWKQSVGSQNNNKSYVAIKAVAKKRLDQCNQKAIRDEIKILNLLDHPNIIKYFEEYENDKYIYLVMEYCNGGDLFDVIEKMQSENS